MGRNAEKGMDAKRLIGRKFADPVLQNDIPYWPFKVINDGGSPKIQVRFKGQVKAMFPEEVSSMVLGKMKEAAEIYLGQKVRNAVITVPAYFSDSQRQATKDAGTIAGLNVLRIINEPTAGALSYGLDLDTSIERNVLIYDLGGGTFDVSVLVIEESVFEVKSTAGDTHLGGEDFDTNMVEHFVQELIKRYNRDISKDLKAIRRLRTACEKAKRSLSSFTETSINIDSLVDGIDFHSKITRARFEELNGELIRSTLLPVEKALRDAGMSKRDIHDVVLVGGSTRIPMVQEMLQKFFDGKELKRSLNPDEAVALGAAIQAANLDGNMSDQIKSLVLVDVTPLSLGTAILGNIMSVIIPRNTTIPTRKTGNYTTVEDNQTAIDIDIREGERSMACDNNLLGKFKLHGIKPMPRGKASIEVTFEVDTDGIIQATALDKFTGKNNKISVKCDKGRLSEQEIKKLIEQAERLKLQDQKRKQTAEARNELEFYCYTMTSRVRHMYQISKADRQTVLNKCQDAVDWLKEHPNANLNHVWDKKSQIARMCESIVDEY